VLHGGGKNKGIGISGGRRAVSKMKVAEDGVEKK